MKCMETTDALSAPEQGKGVAGLLSLAQQGDHGAYAQLVRMHQDAVVSLCTYLLGNRTQGEKAAISAFVKSFERLSSYRSNLSFSTWLYAMAVTVCRERQRNAWQRLFWQLVATGIPKFDEDAAETIAIINTSPRPTVELERKEIRDHLKRALHLLPVHYRARIVLRDIKGLGYTEIAAIMAVPVETIKSGIARARLALISALKEFHNGL